MASTDCAQGENVPLLKGKVQSAVFSTKKSSTPFQSELSIFRAISLEDTISNEEPNIESNQIVNKGENKVQGQRDWGELIKKRVGCSLLSIESHRAKTTIYLLNKKMKRNE